MQVAPANAGIVAIRSIVVINCLPSGAILRAEEESED